MPSFLCLIMAIECVIVEAWNFAPLHAPSASACVYRAGMVLCSTGDGGGTNGQDGSADPPTAPSTLSTGGLSALSKLAATSDTAVVAPTTGAACDPTLTPSERRRNIVLAITAPLAAALLYGYQRANPVNPVALLARMAERSPALPDALASGRPTLVEFYAPWCTACKESAPGMMRLQAQYRERVNFVVIDGDDPRNTDLVRLFGVDGIPHLALINGEKKLAGTLVGTIPERVVETSLEALAEGRPLPYGAATS